MQTKSIQRLSPNFTLAEATKSQTAIRLGIDNTPGEDEIRAMKGVAVNILEPSRANFGNKIIIPSSFYRCLPLNTALGSSPTSQHILGESVDFEIIGVNNYELALWIHKNLIYDKLVLEFYDGINTNSGWVHCSRRAKNNRRESYKTKDGKHYEVLFG